jgi:hypothetical protein
MESLMPSSTNHQFRPSVEALADRCLLSGLGAAHHAPHRYFRVQAPHPPIRLHSRPPAPFRHFFTLQADLPPVPGGVNHNPPVLFNPNALPTGQQVPQNSSTNTTNFDNLSSLSPV